MSFLILVRHGQSAWNLEKKFTGWVDVDLTEKGKLEAEKAGRLIKQKNRRFSDQGPSLSRVPVFTTRESARKTSALMSNTQPF